MHGASRNRSSSSAPPGGAGGRRVRPAPAAAHARRGHAGRPRLHVARRPGIRRPVRRPGGPLDPRYRRVPRRRRARLLPACPPRSRRTADGRLPSTSARGRWRGAGVLGSLRAGRARAPGAALGRHPRADPRRGGSTRCVVPAGDLARRGVGSAQGIDSGAFTGRPMHTAKSTGSTTVRTAFTSMSVATARPIQKPGRLQVDADIAGLLVRREPRCRQRVARIDARGRDRDVESALAPDAIEPRLVEAVPRRLRVLPQVDAAVVAGAALEGVCLEGQPGEVRVLVERGALCPWTRPCRPGPPLPIRASSGSRSGSRSCRSRA